ncbi:MAG: L,D-transpeptidase family protein [Gammaproteobacteria bacterium]|nr:L,D-transpeptidase family protein [Gammaproteobacteria bacterium]
MNKLIAITLLIGFVAGLSLFIFGRSIWYPYWVKIKGKTTVSEVISQIGPKHQSYINTLLTIDNNKIAPEKLAFLAFKDTKKLELWALENHQWQFLKSYPILKTSGVLGPKLREGDRQVPEGIYNIIGFNPNSSYHLSMKINYPNAFDLEKANLEGRNEPGTNIFIHGKQASIGCLAMGDDVIEKLFLLSHQMGIQNIEVIIAPTDFRKNQLPPLKDLPSWTPELYAIIQQKLGQFK